MNEATDDKTISFTTVSSFRLLFAVSFLLLFSSFLSGSILVSYFFHLKVLVSLLRSICALFCLLHLFSSLLLYLPLHSSPSFFVSFSFPTPLSHYPLISFLPSSSFNHLFAHTFPSCFLSFSLLRLVFLLLYSPLLSNFNFSIPCAPTSSSSHCLSRSLPPCFPCSSSLCSPLPFLRPTLLCLYDTSLSVSHSRMNHDTHTLC